MKPLMFLLFYLATFLFVGCAANKDSYYHKGEVDIYLNKAPETTVAVAGLAVLAPAFIDYGISSIKKILAKEADKFTASYGDQIHDSHFYKKVSEGIDPLNYESITLVRKAKINGVPETVSNITLRLSTDDSGTFLSLRPNSVRIDKSKAKLLRTDNTLDLIIQVQIISYWVDIDQQYHAEETANISMPLYNIELGRTYGPNDTELSKNSGWFLPVPLSRKENGQIFGNGTFSLKIIITEVDDFGKRIGSISELIDTNEAALKGWLLQFLEN